MSNPASQPPLRFQGQKHLIHRLVLATLTGRPIHVTKIRPSSPTHPGLAPHEVSFLRLLDRITNGSAIEFSATGTAVLYRPGVITGGTVRHELPATCARGASYFLIPVCLLAPFAKAAIDLTLVGPGLILGATALGDVSVETVRTAVLPLYAPFGVWNNIELKTRGSVARAPGKPRSNNGIEQPAAQLRFGHQVRLPKTLHLLNAGRVKRVRGVAYAVGVSASNNARLTEAARGVLNPLVLDTYVFSQTYPAAQVPDTAAPGGTRRVGIGFGLALVAESSTGVLHSADLASPPAGGLPPEDVGRRCAYQLLESIAKGGCVSATAAPTVLTLMAMGSEDVGRIQMGRDVLGSEDVIALGRDLRAFGASGWGLRDSEGDDDDIIVSVVGRGIGNVGRKVA